MREIKFRAWDKDEKKMDYNVIIAGNRIIFEYGLEENGNIEASSYVDIEEYNEKYFEVMQYVGFKDKNRKEIYEGDIIKSDNSIGKIIYNDCEFRINWVVNKNFFNDVIPRHNKWCEVIGNIYENPNLIPDSVEVF